MKTDQNFAATKAPGKVEASAPDFSATKSGGSPSASIGSANTSVLGSTPSGSVVIPSSTERLARPSSDTYVPGALPPMQLKTPQLGGSGVDAKSSAASLSVGTGGVGAPMGGVKASADVSGRPPMPGGSINMPSMPEGASMTPMTGDVAMTSMSGETEVPSMSGEAEVPSLSEDVGVGAPTMNLPLSKVGEEEDASVGMSVLPSRTATGSKIAALSPHAAESPLIRRYVARVTSPHTTTTASKSSVPRLSSGGKVSSYISAIEHKRSSLPQEAPDLLGSFGSSSKGSSVPKAEVKTDRPTRDRPPTPSPPPILADPKSPRIF